MILLDATTKSLEVVLNGSVTTNQLPIVASYADVSQSTFAIGAIAETDTQTNNATAVTTVAAPAASTTRKVALLSIYNADTASATVTVRLNDNSTLRILVKVALAIGATLTYTDGGGWHVTSATGALLTVPSLIFPSIYTVGDLLYASSSTALTTLSDVATGSVLASGGVSTAPAWSTAPTILGTNITAIPAANLTGSHTLSDGVLSTNVPLLNANNIFTGSSTQTIGDASGDAILRLNALSTKDPRVTFQIGGVDKAKAWWDHTNSLLTLGSGTALSGLMIDPTTGASAINGAPNDTLAKLSVTAGAANYALAVFGTAGNYAFQAVGSSTAGSSFGFIVKAGTNSSDACFQLRDATAATVYMSCRGDGVLNVGVPTGAVSGSGKMNVAGAIYLNGTAYTNPDYALERWATGTIVKHADKPRAATYERWTLNAMEAYAREHWRLPFVVRDAPQDIFERADILLEKMEEAFTFLFDHEHRLKALEG